MFDYVAKHYECPEEEITLMRQVVRKDPEGAKECYPAMAAAIGYVGVRRDEGRGR